MATCVADCTTDTCGNGACDPGEDGYTCPKDCFSPGLCGNHWCDSLENYANCPSDCSACWACGNLHVDPGEECDQGGCPTGQACHACQCVIPICGDGWVYSPTEDCEYPAYCDAGEVCQACECVSPGAGSQPPPPPGPVPPPPGDDPCAEPGVTVETFDVFNCTYDYDSAVWTACEGKRCTTASGERVFDGCVGDTYELDQWVPFCPPGPGEDGGSDDGSDGCGGAAAC